MRDYIIRRLLLIPPMMIAVSLLTFLAFRLVPGDVADLRCGFSCDDETRAAIREDLGLNRPWYEQYGDWLANVAQGDLGKSLAEGEKEVWPEIERRFPITIELMLLTLLFSVAIGIPAGVISAIRPGTPLDFTTRVVSILFLSIPEFYLSIIVLTFGLIWFGWSPPQFGTAYIPIWEDPLTNLEMFIVPSIILSLGISAVMMRLTRSSILEVLRNDYVRTAWAKGLRERVVVTRHVLRNAMIPVVTLLGLQFGALLGGAVIIEYIFALQGIGAYLLESVVRRDFFVVQSVVLFFVLIYVFASLAVDIAYAWLDPRIRHA